jgi:hypothetical protein
MKQMNRKYFQLHLCHFFVVSVFNTHIIQTLAMVLPPSLQSVAVVNLCSRAAIGGLAELTKFNAIS